MAMSSPVTAEAPVPRRWPARSPRKPSGGASWWFVLPALLAYAAVVLLPSAGGAVFAFTDWNGLAPELAFVGGANFERAFRDPQVRSALAVTAVFALAITVLQNIIGLALALLLNTSIRSRNWLRTLLFAPVVVTPVIVAYLWKYLLSSNGAVNQVATALGAGEGAVNWLGDPRMAVVSVVIVTVWQTMGVAMVIYLAGLQNIPEELYEAADMDGASSWTKFRLISFPLLAPAVTINVVLSTVNGLKLFDQVFVLTSGGPGYATETLSTLVYKTSFIVGEFGYATAIALAMTVFVAAVSMGLMAWLKGREAHVH